MRMKTLTHGITELERVVFSDQGNSPISVSDTKLWMRREGVNDELVQIADLIDDSLDQIMRITNRSLVSQTITATYSSYGSTIRLPYGPIATITSVKSLYEGDETTLTVSDDYYLQGDTLYMKNIENTGLEVVYTSGGSFPDGLRNALYQAVLTNYNDREDHVLGGVTKMPGNSREKALRYKRY